MLNKGGVAVSIGGKTLRGEPADSWPVSRCAQTSPGRGHQLPQPWTGKVNGGGAGAGQTRGKEKKEKKERERKLKAKPLTLTCIVGCFCPVLLLLLPHLHAVRSFSANTAEDEAEFQIFRFSLFGLATHAPFLFSSNNFSETSTSTWSRHSRSLRSSQGSAFVIERARFQATRTPLS